METTKDKDPQVLLNQVADAMDAAADQMESSANGQPAPLATISGEIWRPKFAQKLIYSSCYTLSFGVCFPVFLVCRYVPKNNPLVQGLKMQIASLEKPRAENPMSNQETSRAGMRSEPSGKFDEQ